MTVFGIVCASCTLTLQQFTHRQIATLPLSVGGLVLRSATRTKQSAYWATWADSLGVFHNRHSNVADDAFLECLTVGAGPPSLVAAH